MLNRKELAAAWRVSPQMAGRYIKRGCPLDSLENADRWRRTNTLARGHKTQPAAVCITPDRADEIAEAMILENGQADRETLHANLRTLQLMVRQCKAAIAAAIENGDTEAGRRWTVTLTNVLARSAVIAKELQAVLREDGITVLFADAEALYIGLLKEMRQIVLQAVDALPQRLNPSDPDLAREALREWVHHTFMRTMHAQVDRCGVDRSRLNDAAAVKAQGKTTFPDG
jgi:IS5 family transposase